MRLARYVFAGAGVWGMLVLAPLFFLVDISGRQYPPPTDYPQFFYGFFAVALVWQVAFFVVASDPVRFRPLMPVAILEKLAYIVPSVVLWTAGRISLDDAAAAIPDAVLAVLFLIAFARTSPRPA